MESLNGFEINGVSFLVKTTEGDYGIDYKTYQFCGQKVSLDELREIVEGIYNNERDAFDNFINVQLY